MAMDVNHIFSREALDKMRSPEKLDRMLQITNPIGWMGLIAVGVVMFSVVLWSVFGAFSEKADGMGMIMDSAGVVNVSHVMDGKVSEIYVHTGSRVKKGDIIARLEQAARSADTRMALYDMNLSANNRDAAQRASQYDAKKYQEKVGEEIYSDYDGIVDEIAVERGSIVQMGAPICTLRRDQERKDLSGVFYVSVEKGKRVTPGMTLQLSPNGSDTSQNGSLLAVVRSVSEYPVSQQGMQKALGNAQLAQWIFTKENSALVEVHFDLVKDETSPSGYLWTSVVGNHRPVTAGSFCTGSIVIERKLPLSKVFYKFSQWLRSR